MTDTPRLPLATYHARTRHRFEAFAEGPGQLDWDAQPAPFRHYPGAPTLALPLAADRFDRPYGQLASAPKNPVVPSLESIGALFEVSLAISAWKSWGPSRWALRCNPSSGNLHPVEGWLLGHGLAEIPNGLHHYDPEQHQLENRALLPPNDDPPWLALALSSAMWREAWKYGERAFRYCQLDVGHAVSCLSHAAAMLGWQLRPATLPGSTLNHVLGLDREQDFPPSRYAYTETEEGEVLLFVDAPGLTLPADIPATLNALRHAQWFGHPTAIDPAPGYRWPLVNQAALASRPPEGAETQPVSRSTVGFPTFPALPPHPTTRGAAQLFRQRRSGQRFDPKHGLPRADFFRLLDASLPRSGPAFGAQEDAPAIHLLLFVLRVDTLVPGLYLLPRTQALAAPLQQALTHRFPEARRVADAPTHLGLTCLLELSLQETQRLARSLSCHQDIAATSAFSLGMIGECTPDTVNGDAYRKLLREAGMIGQVLYLEAEAAGVRGTGIGCFFDEPVHQTFGITDTGWQSVYHFTVGLPVTDARIETSPPYPQREQTAP
ncbi:MAG: nitroreductase family protein [Azonexus sp.]|nr:nitroreductase family protein [Azonexus sp.]